MPYGIPYMSPQFFTPRGTGGGGFVPTDLANCVVWLPVDGNSPGSVSSWANSGSGSNFVQATSGKQPVSTASQINGHASVLFDGTDDYLDSAISSTGNVWTAFVVFKKDSAGTSTNNFSRAFGAWNTSDNPNSVGDFGGTNGICMFLTSQNIAIAPPAGYAFRNNTPSSYNAASYGSYYIFALRRNGTTLQLYIDGVLASGGTVTTDSANFNFNQIILGDAPAHGGDSVLNGGIGEVVMYEASLTDSEMNQVGNYQSSWSGISWTNI